jgi:hypothetical protein
MKASLVFGGGVRATNFFVSLAPAGAACEPRCRRGYHNGRNFREKNNREFCTSVMHKLLCIGERVLHCKVNRRTIPSKTHGAIAVHVLRFEDDFYQAGLSK